MRGVGGEGNLSDYLANTAHPGRWGELSAGHQTQWQSHPSQNVKVIFFKADSRLACQGRDSSFGALQIFRIRISSTHAPVKNDCVQERRFGLLNTGIYLILSASSDRLMPPGFLPNEFLWLDKAQLRLYKLWLHRDRAYRGAAWGAAEHNRYCVIFYYYQEWWEWKSKQYGAVALLMVL